MEQTWVDSNEAQLRDVGDFLAGPAGYVNTFLSFHVVAAWLVMAATKNRHEPQIKQNPSTVF